MKRFLFVFVFILAIIFIGSPVLHATILGINFDYEFSGATPPEGTTPWLTATIDDETVPGEVTLTLSAGGLVDSEFVSSWYFNVNPIYDPYSVAYPSFGSTPGAGSIFTTDTSQTNLMYFGSWRDSYQADGDSGGLYDFVVGFSTSGDGRLTAGEEFSITFDYDGLTAYDFLYGNEGSTKGGPFVMAAHVQGIGPDDQYSGWVAGTAAPATVPEPSTIVLMGLGMVGLAGAGRKKLFKK